LIGAARSSVIGIDAALLGRSRTGGAAAISVRIGVAAIGGSAQHLVAVIHDAIVDAAIITIVTFVAIMSQIEIMTKFMN